MFKSFKRAVATFASIAILVTTNAGIAFAQTFKDVPTDAWYHDYVEQLVDDGVITPKDYYNPAQALNRAELVKMVITAVDGLAAYKAPATPTFDDVPADAWFYDYVEAAVQLDIVEGYKDANGNLTGLFGPGDTVNRAAAAKIYTKAFSIPTTLEPASVFPDVAKGAWFYEPVVTAYNQSVVDGYDNGRFGPADPVTRAQAAKLTVNAQDPVVRTKKDEKKDEEKKDEEKKDEEKKDEKPAAKGDGALEVSVNDKAAASATIPKSATGAELMSWDFTAADDDVNLTNLTVTRGGVGKTTDWSALYIYEGDMRKTTGRTLNSDTNTVTFPVNITVEAGKTKTVRLVGDIDTNASANNQHYFYIASAADVTSNAKSVAGDFPVAGNTFTVGAVATTTVTIEKGSTPAQPTVGGKNQEIASFKLTAGPENDVAVHQISFTQNGALSSSKIVNLRLLRGNDELATAAGFDGDLVTFALDKPYVIDQGQNRTFTIRADINGGRPVSDTIQLYLEESTDLHVIDQQYGYGAKVTNKFTTAESTALALKGGKITITDNGPASRQVAQNSTNVALFDYSITSDRDVTVKDMDLTVRAGVNGNYPDVKDTVVPLADEFASGNLAAFRTDNNRNGVLAPGDVIQAIIGGTTYYCAITAVPANTTNADVTTGCPSGVAVANTDDFTYGYNPYQWIENVKVVDVDSNATLQGPVTKWNATTTPNPAGANPANLVYSKKMTEDYDLTAGETRHLRVAVDFNKDMPAGLEVDAAINYTTAAGYLKDVNANTNVPTTDIVGGQLTGKLMTVSQNSLTVTKTSTVISQEYVKGAKGVDAFQIAAKAGDAGDITIKKLTVRVYADDDKDFDDAAPASDANATGDIDAKTVISKAYLYDGNTLVAGPETLELVGATTFAAEDGSIYNKVLFDNLNLNIPKGQTKNLNIKLDALNSFSADRHVAIDMDPAKDIEAEDSDDNVITASSGNLNRKAGLNAANPIITFIQGGTLTATSTSGSISPSVLVGGTNEVLVAKYTFTAEKEGYNIDKLTVINDSRQTSAFDTAADTNAINTVKITFPDVNGVEKSAEGSLSGGSLTFSGLPFHVPRDKSVEVKLYANVKSISGGTFSVSGKPISLGIKEQGNTTNTFKATGVSSSATTNFNAGEIKNSSNISTHIVRKAKPVFAKGSQGTTKVPLSQGDLYKFTVTANGGDVSFARLVFDVNTAGLGDAGTNNISSFEFKTTTGTINNVNIYGMGRLTTGVNAVVDLSNKANGLLSANNGQGVADGTYNVIVTFQNEERIGAGQTKTYMLQGKVSGANAETDSVSVKLNEGDENAQVTGIAALYDNDNGGIGNTGHVDGAGGTKATVKATFSGVPTNDITIGACTVTFTGNANDLDCTGGANIKNDDVGESAQTIAQDLDDLTNLTDAVHGTLGIGAAVDEGGGVWSVTFSGQADSTLVAINNGDNAANTTVATTAAVTDALFVAAGAVTSDARFIGSNVVNPIAARNVIWSDNAGGETQHDANPASAVAKSAVHIYPTINTTTVTDFSGTVDWTNGFRLDVDELDAFSFSG